MDSRDEDAIKSVRSVGNWDRSEYIKHFTKNNDYFR
jgi:hypothetical protein